MKATASAKNIGWYLVHIFHLWKTMVLIEQSDDREIEVVATMG
jgi:hypothetical protein